MPVVVVIRPRARVFVAAAGRTAVRFINFHLFSAMGGFTCCVPGCFNNSSKRKGLGFYVFPKETKLRQLWLQRINRAGQRGKFSKFVPTTGHTVCGEHFEGGKKTYMVRVPTVFPLKQKIIKKRRQIQVKRTLPANRVEVQQPHSEETSNDENSTDLCSATENTACDTFEEHSYTYHEHNENDLLKRQQESIHHLEQELEKAKAVITALKKELEEKTKANADSARLYNRLQQKNRCLVLEISRLSGCLRKASKTKRTEFEYDVLAQNEKRLRYYTGFASRLHLEAFWSLLEDDVNSLQFWNMKGTANEDRKFLLPLKTQLIIVLMRLRLGLDGADLAFRFDVSESTVSRLWVTWLDFLHNKLRQVPTWMPPDLCDKYRPQAFLSKGFNTVDGILDCTEIFIETPSSFRVQSETYSLYKKHNTAKGLIVCSPNGFVTFVSDLAPGRLSDKALTNHCGILDKFTPGRSIMADRGFTIADECKTRSLGLNIPPFMGGRPQLSEKDEEETRRIASVRIHVERVIRRVKTFRILSQIFPNSMAEQLNKVWQICALLSNFIDSPLLKTTPS